MDGFYPHSADYGVNDTDDSGTSRSRDSLFLLARLSLIDRDVAREVRVRNLSAGGLMAEYDGVVAIDDRVTIDLRGVGEVRGRIAWATEGRIGIALDQPIDPKKARKPVGSRPAKW